MNIAQARNIGAYLKEAMAATYDQIVAGGAKDNVAQNGLGVNRENYLSAKLMLLAQGTLAASQTAVISAKIQHSSDDGATDAYADYYNPADSITLTDAVANERGIYTMNVDLSGAKKWIRTVYTVNLSAGSIDTVDLMAALAMAGEHERPFV